MLANIRPGFPDTGLGSVPKPRRAGPRNSFKQQGCNERDLAFRNQVFLGGLNSGLAPMEVQALTAGFAARFVGKLRSERAGT